MTKRLYGTYQPNSIVELLQHSDYTKDGTSYEEYKILQEEFGFSPIFAIEYNDLQDFLARSAIAHPSIPQSLILFEAECEHKIKSLDWWSTGLGFKYTKTAIGFKTLQESIFKSIDKESVIAVIPLKQLTPRDTNANSIFWDILFTTLHLDITKALAKTKYKNKQKLKVCNIFNDNELSGTFSDMTDKIYRASDCITEDELYTFLEWLKSEVFRVTK